MLDKNEMTEDVTISLPDATKTLEIDGVVPEGSITISKEGKIAIAVQNGRYCVTKGFDDTDVTITEDLGNCVLSSGQDSEKKTLSNLAKNNVSFTKVDGSAYENTTVTIPECITNKTKCDVGTPVAVEVAPNTVYKFYVLDDDITKNEVRLIMDRNLYPEGNTTEPDIEWINKSDYTLAGGNNWQYYDENEEEYMYGNTEKGPITALKVLKERTSGWTNIPVYTYTLEDSYYTSQSEIIRDLVTDVRAILPTTNELSDAGAGTIYTPDWLYVNLENTGDNNTRGYWTINSMSNRTASNIDSTGKIYYTVVNNDFCIGLRPVITLAK